MEERRDLKIKISRARANLMFFTLLTLFNAVTLILGEVYYIPYQSSAVLFTLANTMYTGSAFVINAGRVIAVAICGMYLAFYFLSKKSSRWLLGAGVAVAVDCLFLLMMVLMSGITEFFLDLIMHGLLVFYLIVGIKAFVDFERLPAYDGADEMVQNDNDFAEEGSEDYDLEEYGAEEGEDESVQDPDEPLGKYDGHAEPLLKGSYEGLEIFAVCERNIAELVINGYVCDRMNVKRLKEYKLRAIVNGVDVTFEYTDVYGRISMFLHANSTLLDSIRGKIISE